MKNRFCLACGALLIALCLTAACSSPGSSPANASPKPGTWGGELTPVVSVKEVMRDIIDPLSDHIFTATGAELSSEGYREWQPRTDEEWAKVRQGAVSMAEASYLLKIPRPIEPMGWERVKRDPDSGELAPPEVLARIEKDPVLWQAKIEALRNVGREVMGIVDKKDGRALSVAAEDLDAACENCHLEFWYPSQKEILRRIQAEAAADHQ